MRKDMNIKDIIDNNLINKSIIKCRKYNVVFEKLRALVNENNSSDNQSELVNETNQSENIDTFEDKDYNNNTTSNTTSNTTNNTVTNNNVNIKPEDYNFDGFSNSHYSIFSKNKLIKNNLSAFAYEGKQYASPFSR